MTHWQWPLGVHPQVHSHMTQLPFPKVEGMPGISNRSLVPDWSPIFLKGYLSYENWGNRVGFHVRKDVFSCDVSDACAFVAKYSRIVNEEINPSAICDSVHFLHDFWQFTVVTDISEQKLISMDSQISSPANTTIRKTTFRWSEEHPGVQSLDHHIRMTFWWRLEIRLTTFWSHRDALRKSSGYDDQVTGHQDALLIIENWSFSCFCLLGMNMH